MNEFYLNTGARIWQLRVAAGYSREVLSEMADISPKFLYEIENGKKGMSAQTLCNISKALGVSSDYLLTGSRPEARPEDCCDAHFSAVKDIISEFDTPKLSVVEKILAQLLELTK